MPQSSAPMNPAAASGQTMQPGENFNQVMDPQNNEEVARGSIIYVLNRNIGNYVIVEFLIGTNNLVAKAGILHSVGNNFVTIYNDEDNYYIICDLFSVKFVNVFPPENRPRRRQQMSGNVLTHGTQIMPGAHGDIPVDAGPPPVYVNRIPPTNNIAFPSSQ